MMQDNKIDTNIKKKKGTICCVPGCKSGSALDRNISFHVFPKDKTIRQVWISRVNRMGNKGKYSLWNPTKHHKICGLHFNKTGKKKYEDKYPRYFPHKTYPLMEFSDSKVVEDFNNYDSQSFGNEVTVATEIDVDNDLVEVQTDFEVSKVGGTPIENSNLQQCDHSYSLSHTSHEECPTLIKFLQRELWECKEKIADYEKLTEKCRKLEKKIVDLEIQLEKRNKHILEKNNKIESLTYKIEQEKTVAGGFKNILNNSEMLHFYTGFQSKQRFDIFLDYINEAYQASKKSKLGRPHSLTFTEEALLILSRLRLGLLETDIAYRFNISQGTVSTIISFWLDLLRVSLCSLNVWPSREIVSKYMPLIFKQNYPNTRIIVDCTEIFIENPSDYVVQGETFSHYKSHNTAKGLVAIAPNGFVSFVSELHPGRDSDKEIFIRSGLLQLLEEGDAVMVDKGVLIKEELNKIGVELIMPPFLSAASGQFSDEELEKTQRIAALRVHVERCISEIKNYRILKYIFPNSAHSRLNQIWKICCLIQHFINTPLLNRAQ